jgi:hypothetical protein
MQSHPPKKLGTSGKRSVAMTKTVEPNDTAFPETERIDTAVFDLYRDLVSDGKTVVVLPKKKGDAVCFSPNGIEYVERGIQSQSRFWYDFQTRELLCDSKPATVSQAQQLFGLLQSLQENIRKKKVEIYETTGVRNR